MNRRVTYTEPDIPVGTTAFTNCAIEVAKLPLDLFLRANDGRKFIVKCRHRKALLQTLSTYCDKDGTRCYPSRETLLNETKFSNGTLDNYLRDLESEELGFIVKGPYAWEEGPRTRRLVKPTVPEAGFQDSAHTAKAGIQDSDSGVQDSEQDSSIGEAGFQDSKAGIQDSKAGFQPRLESTSQYLDLPVEDQPEYNPNEPMGSGALASCEEPVGQKDLGLPVNPCEKPGFGKVVGDNLKQWYKNYVQLYKDFNPPRVLDTAGLNKVLEAVGDLDQAYNSWDVTEGFCRFLSEKYFQDFVDGREPLNMPLFYFAQRIEDYLPEEPTGSW